MPRRPSAWQRERAACLPPPQGWRHGTTNRADPARTRAPSRADGASGSSSWSPSCAPRAMPS
eukprot:scaffold44176_cov61-Phaeocystis_antarctica.AAC.2